MERKYSDYTAEKWPWPRKRSPSAELSSIFKDQASLASSANSKGQGNRKPKAEKDKPAHLKSSAEGGL